jgi:hypothetical protein
MNTSIKNDAKALLYLVGDREYLDNIVSRVSGDEWTAVKNTTVYLQEFSDVSYWRGCEVNLRSLIELALIGAKEVMNG